MTVKKVSSAVTLVTSPLSHSCPELAFSKGCRLLEGDCDFMEFGTRRRRTYLAQDLVIKGLIRAAGNTQGAGHLVGTSNVGFLHLCFGVPLTCPTDTLRAQVWYQASRHRRPVSPHVLWIYDSSHTHHCSEWFMGVNITSSFHRYVN